jgi:DNA-binding GntR family transcriptional regulator
MRANLLASHKTKAQVILNELRSLIVDGQLLPGQRLVQRKLAEKFGCSEIPVREALNSLASLGFVNITPHEGARVSPFDRTQIIETTEIRLVLERVATEQAAPLIPPAGLDELKTILAKMKQSVANGDVKNYGTLNRAFHNKILSYCPNQTMLTLILSMKEKAERGQAVYRILPVHTDKSLTFHKRIVRLIVARRFDALGTAMEEHNRHVLKAMERLLGTGTLEDDRSSASRA